MIKSSILISNKLGLHARASAKLTKLAGSFQSDVHLSRNGRRVNAKSIMGVMMLAAGLGSEVELEVDRLPPRAGPHLGERGARRAGDRDRLLDLWRERGTVTDAARVTVARSDSPHSGARSWSLNLPEEWAGQAGGGGVHRGRTHGRDQVAPGRFQMAARLWRLGHRHLELLQQRGIGILAARDDGAGVEQVAVEIHEARGAGDPLGYGPRELRQALQVLLDKARAHEQVLGRVAAQRQLGRDEQINPSAVGGARLGNDAVCIARQVAHDDVDLGQGNLQRRGHGRQRFKSGNQHCHSGQR